MREGVELPTPENAGATEASNMSCVAMLPNVIVYPSLLPSNRNRPAAHHGMAAHLQRNAEDGEETTSQDGSAILCKGDGSTGARGRGGRAGGR
jgi:hypothetical protein